MHYHTKAVTVQTGCSQGWFYRIKAFIFRKSIVSPTERSENATAFSKLAGKDLRLFDEDDV